MRTTLSLDDDVLAGARQLADASGRSLGAVISDLARSSLTARPSGSERNGILLLPHGPQGSPVSLEEVNELRDQLP